MDLNQIMDGVDLATRIVLFIISLIGTFATMKLPAKWQGEAKAAVLAAEEKMRNALHSAARSGVDAGLRAGLEGAELLSFALSHMIKSVPDAIVGLTPLTADVLKSGPAEDVLKRIPGPIRRVLENIIAAKVDPVLNELRSGGWTAPAIPSGPDLPNSGASTI